MSLTAVRKAKKAFEEAAERLGIKDDNDVQALSVFHELRGQARDVPEMSIEDIDAEIKAARAEKRVKKCHAAR